MRGNTDSEQRLVGKMPQCATECDFVPPGCLFSLVSRKTGRLPGLANLSLGACFLQVIVATEEAGMAGNLSLQGAILCPALFASGLACLVDGSTVPVDAPPVTPAAEECAEGYIGSASVRCVPSGVNLRKAKMCTAC